MRFQLKGKKNRKKLCRRCSERRALYRRGNVVRWKQGYDMCLRCFRSTVDGLRQECFTAEETRIDGEISMAA